MNKSKIEKEIKLKNATILANQKLLSINEPGSPVFEKSRNTIARLEKEIEELKKQLKK